MNGKSSDVSDDETDTTTNVLIKWASGEVAIVSLEESCIPLNKEDLQIGRKSRGKMPGRKKKGFQDLEILDYGDNLENLQEKLQEINNTKRNMRTRKAKENPDFVDVNKTSDFEEMINATPLQLPTTSSQEGTSSRTEKQLQKVAEKIQQEETAKITEMASLITDSLLLVGDNAAASAIQIRDNLSKESSDSNNRSPMQESSDSTHYGNGDGKDLHNFDGTVLISSVDGLVQPIADDGLNNELRHIDNGDESNLPNPARSFTLEASDKPATDGISLDYPSGSGARNALPLLENTRLNNGELNVSEISAKFGNRKEVELVSGSGVYVKKVEKDKILITSFGNPRKLAGRALQALFTQQQLARMSAKGKRNKQPVPGPAFDAILCFANTQRFKGQPSLKESELVEVINNKCTDARKPKENRKNNMTDSQRRERNDKNRERNARKREAKKEMRDIRLQKEREAKECL